LLQGEETAEHEAISRCAQHRLNRGIWTSTGGGDLTRAIAACERLVLLNADLQPFQRWVTHLSMQNVILDVIWHCCISAKERVPKLEQKWTPSSKRHLFDLNPWKNVK